MSERRVGVTGGRDFADASLLDATLLRLCREGDILVHGNARGADRGAATWFHRRGWHSEPHIADWERFGRSAGVRRNQEMVDSGLAFLIAFPGGRGTADMVRRCEESGIPVVRVPSMGLGPETEGGEK